MDFLTILDQVKLPFALPHLLHPPIVHFAVAIPVIILLIEIVNLFIKKRCLNVTSFFLVTLALFIFAAAFFTGKVDGKAAYSLLSDAGQSELKEHKLLGMYLVYGIAALFIIKVITMAMSSTLARAFFVVLLALFIGFTFKQGKDGGELVYSYGANVKIVKAMDDKIFEFEDKLDSTKEELQKCQETLQKCQTEKSVAPEAQPEIKTEKSTQESNQTTNSSANEEINSSSESNESNISQ